MEEISALVLEVGTNQVKCGYSGEDTPKAVFPTTIGVIENSMDVDESSVKPKYFAEDGWIFRESMEIKNPLKDGLIDDFDLFEDLCRFTFERRLRCKVEEFPLMFCEPSFGTQEQRERISELFFEKFNVPGFYVAKQGVLSCFANGRSTGLVVDIGGGQTSVTPVYDGYIVKKAMWRSNFAGNALTEETRHILENEMNIPTVPLYSISKKKRVEAEKPAEVILKNQQNVTESFNLLGKQRVVEEFKENVCAVSEGKFDEELLALRPMKSFEFPSGYNGNFGLHRFKIPEMLIRPDLRKLNVPDENSFGLSKAIVNCINQCDTDLRAQLLNNIILCGGSSLFQNFAERLTGDLVRYTHGKVRINASGLSVERKFSGWIGGSILSSLGTFQQMWVSKQEYEEEGVGIIEKRCQ